MRAWGFQLAGTSLMLVASLVLSAQRERTHRAVPHNWELAAASERKYYEEAMLLKSFHVAGYRSLKNVELKDLDRFNVLYGKNGTGKSNILAAIGAMLGLLEK